MLSKNTETDQTKGKGKGEPGVKESQIRQKIKVKFGVSFEIGSFKWKSFYRSVVSGTFSFPFCPSEWVLFKNLSFWLN